jgi:hypothetical protein
MPEPHLDETTRRLIIGARRATLTTIDARDGRPRSVPICFVAAKEPSGALIL